MATSLKNVIGFPNPVNEVAARVVAGGVVLLCIATLASRQGWLLVPLAAGFWARVLTGPKLSPLGQLATRVVAPAIGPPRLVAGPPKRFAQAIGVVFSTTALVLWFGFGQDIAAMGVVAALAAAAFLESALGLCLGCRMFAVLMRAGMIPEEVCEACSDITLRIPELREPVGV